MTAKARSALVVGGGSGIGAAVAAHSRVRGLSVTVWDIAGDRDVDCDVTRTESIDAAMRATLDRAGAPDQLTVTAGIGHAGLLLDDSVEAWDRVIGVNARGPWLVMRAVAKTIRASGQTGSIVAVSSISAHVVDRNMGLYCASKAALDMVVRVAACEWAPYGIRVNAVAPGVTQTPMLGRVPTETGWLADVCDRTALGRLGTPDDIAATILATHEMEWVTGQSIDCDGGLGLHSPIDSYGATHPPESDRAGRHAGGRS
jgi:NAD(P)-dependent dehydrogenase (short-subunit alcohol dehydrogenase family)